MPNVLTTDNNRNAFVIENEASNKILHRALEGLASLKDLTSQFDEMLQKAITTDPSESDARFRSIYADYGDFAFDKFADVRGLLVEHMNIIGDELGAMWEHERFTRELKLDPG